MQLKCHICHLWRKDWWEDYHRGMKPCDPSGVFSLSRRFRGQPQEGLQIGSGCWVRLIGGRRGGYKWPPSNCLTEDQHIRPTGWHNLGVIYLLRDACNPIRSPPAPFLLPLHCLWNSICGQGLDSRPVWTQSAAKSWVLLALAWGLCSLESVVKVMRMYMVP